MDIIKFIEDVEKLKTTKRTGWAKRGVNSPESVSDHNFMQVLLCLVTSKGSIDRDRAIKMGVVHEIVEAISGDLVSKERSQEIGTVSREEKFKIEKKAMEKLLKNLDKETAREVMDLWLEYEERKTPEAIFVRDCDLAETIIQAVRYHKNGNYKESLEEFWQENKINKIKNDNIKNIVKQIVNKGQ